MVVRQSIGSISPSRHTRCGEAQQAVDGALGNGEVGESSNGTSAAGTSAATMRAPCVMRLRSESKGQFGHARVLGLRTTAGAMSF